MKFTEKRRTLQIKSRLPQFFLLKKKKRKQKRFPFSSLKRHKPLLWQLLMSGRLARMEQQFKDRNQSKIEMDKVNEDLLHRFHDQQVARDILTISFDDWRDWGGIFEKPFGEGSSKSKPESKCIFRLYFKVLVREEKVGGEMIKVAGIGVAICDSKDNLIFEVRKPMPGNGLNKISANTKALIEWLNAAIALE